MAIKAAGETTVKPYPLVEDLIALALRVRMPRAPRVVAPGGTMHVVARCNNREFYFTTADDFDVLLAHLRELIRIYEVTVYAYTLWHPTFPSRAAEEVKSYPHTIKKLGPNWCPVPFAFLCA